MKNSEGIASFQLFFDADGYEGYIELDTLRDSYRTSFESFCIDGPHLWHNTSSKIDGCKNSVLKGSGLFSKNTVTSMPLGVCSTEWDAMSRHGRRILLSDSWLTSAHNFLSRSHSRIRPAKHVYFNLRNWRAIYRGFTIAVLWLSSSVYSLFVLRIRWDVMSKQHYRLLFLNMDPKFGRCISNQDAHLSLYRMVNVMPIGTRSSLHLRWNLSTVTVSWIVNRRLMCQSAIRWFQRIRYDLRICVRHFLWKHLRYTLKLQLYGRVTFAIANVKLWGDFAD